MAKNPGRGNKIFRRNSIPNVVGLDKTTAESTLSGLGFNYNTTNEGTGNSGLNNKIKSQDIAAGTVEELGQIVNLVNYTFSFSPFGAFGFTPFGFTPFGFTPFGAFGFTPWVVGPCVHEDTLIRTPNGDVPAKDMQINDVMSTINIKEVPLGGLDSDELDWRSIAIPTLTSLGNAETIVTEIVPSVVQEVVWFNGESESKFSLNHPMFIKGDPYYVFVESGGVQVGDVLIKVAPNGSIIEVPITSVDTDDSSHTVISFSCEPQDWFISGNYLVHNK
jgi:hypothetical protein